MPDVNERLTVVVHDTVLILTYGIWLTLIGFAVVPCTASARDPLLLHWWMCDRYYCVYTVRAR